MKDWKELQRIYDEEKLSWRDLQKRFKISSKTIADAVSKGNFQSRSLSESISIVKQRNPIKHTEETKRKLSIKQMKFLLENPDKVPYRMAHSSKKSYPEQRFENALIQSGINNYKYNYQNGIYSYDFAFIEEKIDVKIDGATHLTDKVIKIDTRRDEWSKLNGWIVLRFTAKEVKYNLEDCIYKLKTTLENWRNRIA